MSELAKVNQQHYSQANFKYLGTFTSPSNTSSPASPSTAELQAWMDQAKAYYEAVISGDPNTPKPSATDWNTFLDEWNFTQEKLQGAGSPVDWDPKAASPIDTAPVPDGAEAGTMKNITWSQPISTMIFNGDSRVQDSWSQTNTLRVTNLSVTVHASLALDSRWNPPEEALKVVMHDKATGKETTYFVHDLGDAGKHIDFNTASLGQPSQDQIDAINLKYPGLVTRSNYDPKAVLTPAVKAPASEPAATVINGEQWWKTGSAVNYIMTPGSTTDHILLDAADLNSDDRTYKVNISKVGPHHYNIEYLDQNGNSLRKIDADQTTSLRFKGVYAGNVTYTDTTSNPAVGPATWDSFTASPDAQIQVEGSALGAAPTPGAATPSSTGIKDGQVVNPDGVNDSPADTVDLTNHAASYTTADPAELTALYSDDPNAIQHYDISNARQVTLHKGDKNDKVNIDRQDNGDFVITFTSRGKKQVFTVHGGKVKIDASVDNITYGGNDYVPGMDPGIAVTGESFPQAITDLKAYLQSNGNNKVSEADILATARSLHLTDSELKNPSIPPNQKFIDFLLAVDLDLKSLHDAMNKGNADSRGQVRDHLVDLLTIFYPNQDVHPNSGRGDDGDHLDDIVISGQGYDVIDDGSGAIRFSSY